MKTLLLSVACLVSVIVYCQPQLGPAISSQRNVSVSTLNGSLATVVKTSDGYIGAGAYENAKNSVSGYDYTIVKFDKNWNILWYKYYGGGLNDYAYDIKTTADGGYIVTGTAESTNGDVVGHHKAPRKAVDADAWILKLDSNGNIQWQQCLGGDGPDVPGYVQAAPDGGYIIAGQQNSHGWLCKLDAGGGVDWQKVYALLGPNGLPALSYLFSADTIPGGGYITGGQTIVQTSTGQDYQALIIRVNSLGETVWQKVYGGSGSESVKSIVATEDSGFVFAGTASSKNANGDVVGNHGGPDVWLVKLSNDGSMLWQNSAGGSLADGTKNMQIIPANDGFIVLGTTISDDGDVSGYHTATRKTADLWVTKFNAQGWLTWQRCYGGTGVENPLALLQESPRYYTLVSTTTSTDGDVTAPGDGMWVVSLREDTLKNQQAITFTPLPVKYITSADFSPGAAASSGLNVNYTSSDTTVATIVTGARIHIKALGSTIISATQKGNGHYYPAMPVTQTLQVVIHNTAINLTAKKQAGNILLQWQTAVEQRSRNFKIQRSIDTVYGNNNAFKTFDSVPAAGNSPGLANYSFVDTGALQIPAPILYYRIISTDSTGHNDSSIIISIACGPGTAPTMQWQKIGFAVSNGQTHAVMAVNTPGGGYAVVGYFDHTLIELNAVGDVEFTKDYTGNWLTSITAVPGGYIARGDKFIKLDSNFNQLWSTAIGTGTFTTFSMPAPDGGGYLFGDGATSAPNNFNTQHYYTRLTKLDTLGNLLWSKDAPGRFYDLQFSPDKGYQLAGEAGIFPFGRIDSATPSLQYTIPTPCPVIKFVPGGFLGLKVVDNDSTKTYQLVKFDNNGNILWTTDVITAYNYAYQIFPQTFAINSVDVDTDGGYALSGWLRRGGKHYKTPTNREYADYNEFDGWMGKVTSNGALEWQQAIGNADDSIDLRGDDVTNFITHTADGGYFLTGYTGLNYADSYSQRDGGHGGFDGWRNQYIFPWVIKFGPSTLPVQFTAFTAQKQKYDALLKWQTATEFNSKQFNVQRSLDGVHFNNIGSKPAAGQSGTATAYSYIDVDALGLKVPVIYYRIQEADNDGRYTYTKVASLLVDDSRLYFAIAPNPVHNAINIRSNGNSKAMVRVTDMNGRILYSSGATFTAGGITSIPVLWLARGMYVVSIQGGGAKVSIKVVKE